MEHLCSVVERHGSDAWWQLPEEELLPPSLVEQYRVEGRALPRKVGGGAAVLGNGVIQFNIYSAYSP